MCIRILFGWDFQTYKQLVTIKKSISRLESLCMSLGVGLRPFDCIMIFKNMEYSGAFQQHFGRVTTLTFMGKLTASHERMLQIF